MGYLPVKILEKYGTLQKFPKKKIRGESLDEFIEKNKQFLGEFVLNFWKLCL